MNTRRVVALARRVMRQVLRDHRTVGLLIVGPILVLTLGAVLFRTEPAQIPLGIVQQDQGANWPGLGSVVLADRVVSELAANDGFRVVQLTQDVVDARLRDGTVEAIVIFPPDFSAAVSRNQAVADLRLEGSNPTRSASIVARVTQGCVKAVAELAASATGGPMQGGAASARLPVTVRPSFLFGGPAFDTFDYIAPVYIAFLALFFVFLLSCVSFLRERSLGTLERLLATPVARAEIVLGYMMGLGLFALIQVSIILFYSLWALDIHHLGNLLLLFVIIVLLAVVGVSLGILASAFARNEFQVVQFIPLVIIPQALLGGTIWPVEEMPGFLRPVGYMMPVTYANRALRDVMLKGWGVADIWPNLAILLLFAAAITALGVLTMRREVA